MVRALVTRGSISVAEPGSRLPVDHLQGEVVELTNTDFDRLFEAGAVVRADVEAGSEGNPPAGDGEGGDGGGEAGTAAVDEDAQAEYDHKVGALLKLTHAKIDQAGRKAGIKNFPKGATKRDKAEAIVAKQAG